MNRINSSWLKTAALSGILTPIIAFACILTAIALYSPFSWTDNALSDLGVVEGATAIIFNGGLIISGILALIFAVGMHLYLKESALGKIGSFLFALDALALMAIGVFPEKTSPHFPASVAFFALFPLAMIFTSVALIKKGEKKMAIFSLLAAVFSITVWTLYYVTHFAKGVAIPETLTSLAVSAWALTFGFKILRQLKHQ